MSFEDHFSAHADDYARHRPHYPDALYDHLAGLAPARRLAWDCATGNGQAANGLAARFERVVATDASAQQIGQARGQGNVVFHVAAAEASALDAATVDLVTVAQALHWFDLAEFLAEVRRVLRPDGVLAVWSYDLMQIDAAVDAVVRELYYEVLDGFWRPERELVVTGYRTLELGMTELEPPSFTMTHDWSADQVWGYIATWSAYRGLLAANGAAVLQRVRDRFVAAWGSAPVRTVHWPLYLRVCRA